MRLRKALNTQKSWNKEYSNEPQIESRNNTTTQLRFITMNDSIKDKLLKTVMATVINLSKKPASSGGASRHKVEGGGDTEEGLKISLSHAHFTRKKDPFLIDDGPHLP